MKTFYNFFVPHMVFENFDQKQCAVHHLGIIIDPVKVAPYSSVV
jgi:hypothetical protein